MRRKDGCCFCGRREFVVPVLGCGVVVFSMMRMSWVYRELGRMYGRLKNNQTIINRDRGDSCCL